MVNQRIFSQVQAVGSYLPEQILTNQDLAEKLDTSDEWIQKRTGIKKRHIAQENEYTSTLAINAAKDALAKANMTADDIDLIIVATATPDHTFPSTASQVQHGLGMSHGAAFDVQAVCTGFVYATSVADAMIRSSQAKSVLVIGAETFSNIVDWEDRGTAVLFGDGAGAMILKAVEQDIEDPNPRGVLANYLRSDGQHKDKLYVDGGVSTTQSTGKLRMLGSDVFKLAVRLGSEVIDHVLEASHLQASDVDWLVPHQANQRIISAIAKHYGMPMEKVVLTVSDHANTSAASVPLALAAAIAENKIKKDDIVLLEAMGGGFTWGASIIRW